jgi:hypothetical protein
MVNTKIVAGICVAVAAIIAVLAVVLLDTSGESGNGLGRAYEYDVEEMAWIDPNLFLYEQAGQPIRTGFASARAIAVDSEDVVYVAGDEVVKMFSASGALRGKIALSSAPRCLTVGDDSKVYIGMKEHVEVYDVDGKRVASWASLGADSVLTSIAVYKNNVFVADAGNRVVLRFGRDGELVKTIGERDRDRNIPGFVVPSAYFDVAVGGDGLLRVVDPGRLRIEAYTFDGDLEFSWGGFSSGIEGFTGCCNPVNFAMLADGGFVTCEKGIVRVKVYDASGGFVGVVAGPEQLVRGGEAHICEVPAECQSGGFDVAVDSLERVLVLDTIKNIVRIFVKMEAE